MKAKCQRERERERQRELERAGYSKEDGRRKEKRVKRLVGERRSKGEEEKEI